MAAPTYAVSTPYCDETYGTAYCAERLETSAWDNAISATRVKALKMATKLIDTLVFVGVKTVPDVQGVYPVAQPRQFPRNGETDIPTEVMDATVEVALKLLEGKTLDSIVSAVGIASESIGDASTSYEAGGATKILDVNLGLPSPEAARLLAPWLEDEGVIRLERVS
jgi:hypothetical protein